MVVKKDKDGKILYDHGIRICRLCDNGFLKVR